MAINGKDKGTVKTLTTGVTTTEANFRIGIDDIIEEVDNGLGNAGGTLADGKVLTGTSGSAFSWEDGASGGVIDQESFTSSGTYTVSSRGGAIGERLVVFATGGGGGSGGMSTSPAQSHPGGAAGRYWGGVAVPSGTTSITVTVGTGGPGGSGSQNNANAGNSGNASTLTFQPSGTTTTLANGGNGSGGTDQFGRNFSNTSPGNSGSSNRTPSLLTPYGSFGNAAPGGTSPNNGPGSGASGGTGIVIIWA